MQDKELKNLVSALLPSEQDEPYHLSESELTDYAEGDADDVTRELAETHLEVCQECSQALEKLRAPKVVVPAVVAAPARLSRIAALAVLAIGVVVIALLAFWAMRPHSSPVIAGGDAKPAEGNNTPAPGPASSESPNVAAATPDDGQTILKSEEISPSLRKAIQLAWTSQRLEKPQGLTELNDVQGRLLGGSSDGVPFQLVNPIGRVVQSRTPTFTWKPLAGAVAYTVLIADEKLEEVASSARLTETRWTVPVPLKRGHTYSWQVTAFKDGQRITSPVLPAPQAKFKVLETSRDAELKHLKQSLPDYHLGLGVLYTQAGMLDEAEQEFHALLKEKPNSPAAAKLLQSVKAMKQ